MTTFDEDTKLKLIGLQAVVKDLWAQIEAFQKVGAKLVGEPITYGHTSDFLSGDSTIEELWERITKDREAAGK